MAEINMQGKTIGSFEIVSPIGRGGMSVVYKARQKSPQRLVALKVLQLGLSHDERAVARFRQEAESAAALGHPHIVPIFAVGEDQGFHYIAMQYIVGETLRDIIQTRGVFDLSHAALTLAQVAEALDFAHWHGIIHRDIKPSNILVNDQNRAYLTDFGIARGTNASDLTLAGTVLGTPEYMSPEQAQGLKTLGPSTDVYALGVVLYELLTGQMPFQADTPMGTLVARLQRPPNSPREYRSDLPSVVEEVVLRALNPDPTLRYRTAGGLSFALKRAIGMERWPFVAPQPTVRLGHEAASSRVVERTSTSLTPLTPASGQPRHSRRRPIRRGNDTSHYVISNVGATTVMPRAAPPHEAPSLPVDGTPPPAQLPSTMEPHGAPPAGVQKQAPLSDVSVAPAAPPTTSSDVALPAVRSGSAAPIDKSIDPSIAPPPVQAPNGRPEQAAARKAPPAPTPTFTAPEAVERQRPTPAPKEAARREAPDVQPVAPKAKKQDSKGLGLSRGLVVGICILGLLLGLGLGIYLSFGRGNPGVVQAMQAGASALEQPGGFDRAITAYTGALAIAPENADLQAQIALVSILRGQYLEAEQAARAALKIGETAFGQAMLAEALSYQSRRAEALNAAERAVALDGAHWAGYAARATINADRAVDLGDAALIAQALDDANRAVDLANRKGALERSLAHNARGNVHWQAFVLTGDSAQAEQSLGAFSQAIQLQSSLAVFYTNQGMLYNSMGDEQQAQAQFNRALELDPVYSPAHTGIGWSRYYTNDDVGAIEAFDQAIAVNAQDINAYIGKARVYQDQEASDYPAAIDTLTKAAEVIPNNVRILVNLGWARREQAVKTSLNQEEQKTAYRESEEWFRQALQINPDETDALTGLGWALYNQARLLQQTDLYQESVEELNRSLKLKDNQPYAHSALGWNYYALEDYAGAEAAFNRAIELRPEYADAFLGLGDTLTKQNRLEEARAAYEQARSHGSPAATERLKQLDNT